MNPRIMSGPCRLIVPSVLTHNSFEFFLDQLPGEEELKGTELILDLRLLSALSAYGALTLRLLCRFLHFSKIAFALELEEPSRGLLSDWGFFRSGEGIPQINNCYSGAYDFKHNPAVFLRLARVGNEQDIYSVIDYVRDKLSLPQEQTNDLVVALSEISQNILEHSQSSGFVAIGKDSKKINGKEVLDICVGDSGIGIPASLESRLRQCDRQDLDRVALYKTLFEGVSRHDDPGRGNGIIKTRGIIERRKGKMMLRSGRAKLWGNIASWQIERFMRKSLCFFPGTQVNISFPL